MRFVFSAGAWSPTDGAIIPELLGKAAESAQDAATNAILSSLHDWGVWFGINGLPIITEMAIIWGMACFLIGCTGSGKWVERGAKSMLIALMFGVAKYAI
jgi:hypothetical protein